MGTTDDLLDKPSHVGWLIACLMDSWGFTETAINYGWLFSIFLYCRFGCKKPTGLSSGIDAARSSQNQTWKIEKIQPSNSKTATDLCRCCLSGWNSLRFLVIAAIFGLAASSWFALMFVTCCRCTEGADGGTEACADDEVLPISAVLTAAGMAKSSTGAEAAKSDETRVADSSKKLHACARSLRSRIDKDKQEVWKKTAAEFEVQKMIWQSLSMWLGHRLGHFGAMFGTLSKVPDLFSHLKTQTEYEWQGGHREYSLCQKQGNLHHTDYQIFSSILP